ncbi:TPA: protein-export chaperone SecB [Vibrio cholerae]|nr:protein-export chaperone SecB [Vibrio cholerae]HDZ9478737.1 protein-export chaperone SecB [Vibrio cholerae]
MSDEHRLHPIQIMGVKVRELSVRNNSPIDDNTELEGKFKFKVAHGKYDEESSSINVGLIIELGTPETESSKEPLDLRVHILAKFHIDAGSFPVDKLEHWAQFNAPMILYPYAREHVYSLTGRVLSSPVLLPLLQVPTLKFN